jgi:hypothetical protein
MYRLFNPLLLTFIFLISALFEQHLFAQAVNPFHKENTHSIKKDVLIPYTQPEPLTLQFSRLNGIWQEYELFHLDTLFNIINRGPKRIYGELNGRKFILTTDSKEITRGDYIFVIPAQDTVLIDISRYLNPGFFDTTPLRLLTQGPQNSDADIIIGDESAKLKQEVDFVLELDGRGDGDANGDGFTHEREDQFVELVNTGAAAVDISGWKISIEGKNWHTFLPGTSIEAGKFVVVFGGGIPTNIPGKVFVANYSGFNFPTGLKNKNGKIELLISSGDIVDSLSYFFEEDICQSLTRSPDGEGSFAFHSAVINAGRRLFSPGRTVDGDTMLLSGRGGSANIVINEVLSDPAADNPQYPTGIRLLQNYPNPFNNETVIRFTVPESYPFGAEVGLTIFNSLGQKIITLASGRYFPGTIECRWNGRNERGDLVASGFYVAQLIIGKQQKTRRLILLR